MKHALRSLAKSPGFTFVAILILALGIGFSSSTFSVTNLLLLREVPYSEPAQLVRIFTTSPNSQNGGHAPGNFYDLRTKTTSFSGVASFNRDRLALGLPGEPAEQIVVLKVTPNFFDVLGTSLLLGRGFAADEDQPGKSHVLILPYATWDRRYGRDPSVLGRTVRLDTESYTIIGVLPPGFEAPLAWGISEYVMPRQSYPGMITQRDGSWWINACARLKPGVTIAAAQAELAAFAQQLALAYPKDNAGRGFRIAPLHDANMNDATRTILWFSTGFAIAMMLIACANLASLQFARALGRQKDFAVRAALGGSRRQLMTPLLLEGLLLAAAGGVLGLLVAIWSNDLVGRYLHLGSDAATVIPLDGRVLVFALVSALLCGLAFSLLPAWLSARVSAADALKDNARASTGGRGQQRLKSALMIGQLTAAITLVSLTVSFTVGFKKFLHRDLGWRMDGLFVGDVVLPAWGYQKSAPRDAFTRALLDRLTALPGVDHAAFCGHVPDWFFGTAKPVQIEGHPIESADRQPIVYTNNVTSGYFATLGIPVLQGATFAPNLTSADPAVAIVNESFARQLWPGVDPIGRRFRFGSDERWLQVVGVVGDVRIATGLTPPASRFQMYRPFMQDDNRYYTIALRSSLSPESLEKTLRAAVAALDADAPVSSAGVLSARLARGLANNDLMIVNFAISAGMGLFIAAIGLTGVISQLVQQRRREIGIRLALGAEAANILRLIVGEGAKLVAAGLVLGVVSYYGLHTVLHHSMSEVQFPGLWLLAPTLVVLSVVMLLACYLPARRATRVNPIEALRSE